MYGAREADEICPVCHDEFPFPPIVLLPCGHVVCGTCILEIEAKNTKVKCPIFFCNTAITGHVLCKPMRNMMYGTVDQTKKDKESEILSKLGRICYFSLNPSKDLTFWESWGKTLLAVACILSIAILVLWPSVLWRMEQRTLYNEYYDYRSGERNDAREWYIKVCIIPPPVGNKETISSQLRATCDMADELRHMNVEWAAFGDLMHRFAGLKSKRKE